MLKNQYTYKDLVSEWAKDEQGQLSNFDFQNANFLATDLNYIYMPSTIKYISFGRNNIFFVTNDDPSSVKYMKYWRASDNVGNRLDKEIAKECYDTDKYSELEVEGAIKGIQVAGDYIFVVAFHMGSNQLYIHKFRINKDDISKEPTSYYIPSLEINHSEDTVKFVIASCSKLRNVLLLYGIDGNKVYTGDLRPNGHKVELAEISKLNAYFGNPSLALTLKDVIIKDKQEYVQYLGIACNESSKEYDFFEYHHPTSSKNPSKFIQKIPYSGVNNQILTATKTDETSLIKVAVRVSVTKSEVRYKDFYLFSNKSQKCIYVVRDDVEAYSLFHWTYQFITGDTSSKWVKIESFDTFCVIEGQILVLGSVEDSNWQILTFPYYKSRGSDVSNMTTSSDNLFDS